MEKTIKRAIEGGYSFSLDMDDENDLIFPLLTPEFWKCLGKAEGWVNSSTRNQIDQLEIVNRWEVEWHKLIDHLAEGKDINSFFDNLLK